MIRLEGVQRALRGNTDHNYVLHGTHIFSPQNGAYLTETKDSKKAAGGSLVLYYNIPVFEEQHYSKHNLSLLRMPEDARIEMEHRLERCSD